MLISSHQNLFFEMGDEHCSDADCRHDGKGAGGVLRIRALWSSDFRRQATIEGRRVSGLMRCGGSVAWWEKLVGLWAIWSFASASDLVARVMVLLYERGDDAVRDEGTFAA